MKKVFKFLLIAIVSLSVASSISHATVVLSIAGGRLNDQSGNTIANNRLLQLVNLGADGVFNQINLADGGGSGLNQWVSGDDTLLNVALIGSDFANTNAFDLAVGPDAGDGTLNRTFEYDLANLPGGANIGLRWFPSINATNFASGLVGGERYGQFSRQTGAVWGGDLWDSPAADGFYTLDPLITQHLGGGGAESNSLGDATQIVIVPEPASVLLAAVGITSLCGIRRRRKV